MRTKDEYTFTGVAKRFGKKKEIGVWTDGVMLSTDELWPRDYELKEGRKYKVTVEEIE